MNRNPIFQLTLANLKSAYREPSTLFWVFVFPLLLTLALGIAFREKAPDPIVTAIVDSPGAKKLWEALEQDPQLKVFLLSDQEAYRKLGQGQVTLVVTPGNPRVYTFDPTNPESQLARSVVDDVIQRAEGRQDVTPTIDSFLTESGSRYIDLLLPGLIGLNIMSTGLWGIGYSIVETRTRKLLKRLVATPMRKSHFLLSAVIVRVLFLCLELPVLLLFGWLVFDIVVKGSLVLFIGMAFLGAFCFAGIGILAASRAGNTHTITGIINIISMPMFILSGVFFSYSRFPEILHPFIRVLPLTALVDSLRAIMNQGAGLKEIAPQASILAIIAATSFGLGLRIFRWNY